MPNRRSARLNEQMKREIAGILRTDVRDPRIGMPTITEVEVTTDLWLARVHVRPDPTQSPEDTEKLFEGLTAAAPFIRRALGKALGVRRVPELRFLADRTLEDALRVERILREVQPLGGGDEAEPDLPSDPEQE